MKFENMPKLPKRLRSRIESVLRGPVPCQGCTLCCERDAVRLLPGDDAGQYETEPHAYIAGALMLAHQADGRCVYLVAGGCSIQGTKPRMCRELDCRLVALKSPPALVRRMGGAAMAMRGLALLSEALGLDSRVRGNDGEAAEAATPGQAEGCE